KNTPEFNKMKNALEEVQKCDPNNRKELRSRLKALGAAAKEYQEKKIKKILEKYRKYCCNYVETIVY
ncbi:MAG: hypothetical protein IIV02_09290, partial [Peptococcaceae bacterium]|nr:hypothetical protein [Peptococcaceae bacterium]